MHIALYSDTFEPQVNGVAVVVETIGKELVNQGHRVTICTVTSPGHPVAKLRRIKPEPYRVIRYASASWPAYKEHRLTLPTVIGSAWWAEQDRPDVIHAHSPFAMGAEAAALAKVIRRPLVWTAHTFFVDYAKHLGLFSRLNNFLVEKYEPWLYNRGDLITVPSRALSEDLQRRKVRPPVVTLENPVDIQRFAASASLRDAGRHRYGLKSKTIIYFGRLSYEKNIDALLDAVAPVLLRHKDWQMLIVGEGPVRSDLLKHVQALSIAGQLQFTGLLTGQALVEVTGAADVFVTASLTENQPISVIEAQAAGLPVVAYAARGIPEIVEHQKSGILVEPEEADQFAAAIEKVLADDAARQKMSAYSKHAMQRFDVTTVVTRLVKFYEQLSSKK